MAESLAATANRLVPFPLAASWAGVGHGDAAERGSAKDWCPFSFLHLDGGAEKAFRVYQDHGWCFAERRYFTSVSLLAAVWGLEREEAAAEALKRVDHVPVTYAHLWEEVQRPQDPGREFLAGALREWCRGNLPGWESLQYDQAVSARLAACLALLPRVNSADDCQRWLEGCKKAMGMAAPS